MLFVCLQRYIVLDDSWNVMFQRYNNGNLQQKDRQVMLISRHPQDVTWNRLWPSSHVITLALLFPMKWQSKHRFCFVQVDETYQPRQQRCILHTVSNGSGLSLRFRVQVKTEQSPNWRSGSLIHPNHLFGYSLMEIAHPVWIGRVVSRLSSG